MTNVFWGATASRVMCKGKLSSSVRWLTDFCTLTSGGSLEGHLGIFGLFES